MTTPLFVTVDRVEVQALHSARASCELGKWQFRWHHGTGTAAGTGWTLSGCCSCTGCSHPPAAHLLIPAPAGVAGCCPYLGYWPMVSLGSVSRFIYQVLHKNLHVGIHLDASLKRKRTPIFLKYLLFYVYVCPCMYAHMCVDAHRGQKKQSHPILPCRLLKSNPCPLPEESYFLIPFFFFV